MIWNVDVWREMERLRSEMDNLFRITDAVRLRQGIR